MTDEVETLWKETAVAYYKALYYKLYTRIEKKHEKLTMRAS